MKLLARELPDSSVYDQVSFSKKKKKKERILTDEQVNATRSKLKDIKANTKKRISRIDSIAAAGNRKNLQTHIGIGGGIGVVGAHAYLHNRKRKGKTNSTKRKILTYGLGAGLGSGAGYVSALHKNSKLFDRAEALKGRAVLNSAERSSSTTLKDVGKYVDELYEKKKKVRK